MTRELPVPEFHRAESAARWSHQADAGILAARAVEWRQRHAVRPAAADERRIELLLVDLQRDFCLPEGALYVGGRSGRGAIEDSARIAQFVYRNLDRITSITATLDTHLPFQIFSPEFWVDRDGGPVSAHREVTAEQVRRGDLRPDPVLAGVLAPGGDARWLERQALAYCQALEAGGRYRLYLWPSHCLLGSAGHGLTGVVDEARLFHSFVRRAPTRIEVKGLAPLTESYSVLAPEVLVAHDGRPLGRRNEALIEYLLGADALVVAGEAASHCVKSTLEDLLVAAAAIDSALARRIWILEDCMSAVAVPDAARPGELAVDFTAQAEAAMERFAAAGCRLLCSTEPLPVPD